MAAEESGFCPSDYLDVHDARTLRRLLSKAGLRVEQRGAGNPRHVFDFFERQTFLDSRSPLTALTKALLRSTRQV